MKSDKLKGISAKIKKIEKIKLYQNVLLLRKKMYPLWFFGGRVNGGGGIANPSLWAYHLMII